MKATRLLPLLVLVIGTALTSARAQFVHLSFRDFEGTFIYRANSALIPWDHSVGHILRLDVYYDPLADAHGGPLDPTKNVWRALVTSEGLGNFTIVRPIDQIFSSERSLEFRYYRTDPYGQLDLSVDFSPKNLGSGLPVPPLTFGDSFVNLAGGEDFFPIRNLGEAYGFGEYRSVKAEWVNEAGFSPVPEPSTYGLAAGVLLTGLVLKRRHWSAKASKAHC